MTSVGYAGGHAADPTYESVCSGSTGHTEVVKIQFDSSILSLKELLRIFWECHDLKVIGRAMILVLNIAQHVFVRMKMT